MKKILPILLSLALILAAVCGYLYFNKELLLVSKIQKDFGVLTGTRIALEGVRIKMDKEEGGMVLLAEILKVKVQNPPGFRIPNMALVKDVSLVFELMPLLSGQWRIHKLSFYLSKAEFEYNGQGKLNVLELLPLQSDVVEKKASQPVQPGGPFTIEKLQMTLGTLYFLDFRNAAKPSREKNNFKKKIEVYNQVDDPAVLIQAPILVMINQLNKGSLGISRGKIQENITRHTKQS